MLSYYSKLSAEVYDLDKNIGSTFGDIAFYRDRLATCKGKILEPGVGTGRTLIPLLEAGFTVEGFDVSDEMLRICRRHCAERGLETNVFSGKMESFSLPAKYEAIIIPTGTFLLLHEREDSIKALKNFHHHLSPGGKLIVDIFLQPDVTLNQASTKTWRTENGDVITLEKKVIEVDYIKQYTVSHHRYEKWRDGQLIQTELEHFPLRWYGVEEFRNILETTGFHSIIISADYEQGLYPTNAHQSITFEAVAK